MRLEESHTYYAKIDDNGRPRYKQLDRVKKIHHYFRGRHVEIEMREAPEEGTNAQLRYLFGVVVRDGLNAMRAAGNKGMRKKRLYEILVEKFGPEEGDPFIDKDTGEIFYMKKSLSKMSKEERSAFIEQSVEWLTDYFGITIPPPPEKE